MAEMIYANCTECLLESIPVLSSMVDRKGYETKVMGIAIKESCESSPVQLHICCGDDEYVDMAFCNDSTLNTRL